MALGDAWGFDGLTYSGKEMRELVEALTGGLSGVTGGASALAVSQQTVAAATVKVAEGGAVIPATGAGLGGSFQVYNDADLTSPTINPTSANGRKDRLILRVTSGVPALEVVEGTASGSPAEPSITGDNYLELALITLPASTTNITDAMITDRRVRLAPAEAVVTSSTRPSSPFEGMRIYETDTDKTLVYSGSAWVETGRLGAPTPFTAVLRNSGQSPVAVTTDHSGWTRTGRMVTYIARVVASGNSAGTGLIELDLPVDAVAVNNLQMGTMTFVDASAGPNTHYHAAAYIDTSTSPHRVYGIRDNVVGAGGMATQLGTSDVVTCAVTYPAAS